MAKPTKAKNNLFSGGILANAAISTETTSQLQTEGQGYSTKPIEEEDDPFFGNAKRIHQITQQAEAITDSTSIPKVAIDLLDNNPYQPRRRINEARLETLANEIRDYGFKGVLVARLHPEQPNRYQLVFGHRRREAARRAGLLELPVIIDNTISDKEMKAVAVTENVLREDLTPLDEAYAFTAWQQELSQEAIAARLGVSRGYIRNRLDILKAPVAVQDMVEEKPDTMKAVVYLKDVQEEDILATAIEALKQEQVTINQLKAFIDNLRKAKMASTTLLEAEKEIPTLPEKLEERQQYNKRPAQKEEQGIKTISQAQIERGIQQKRERSIIQQSKEQTESLTDKTRIETFTKYLQKYDQRLSNRSITPDEKMALNTLIEVVRNILEQHA